MKRNRWRKGGKGRRPQNPSILDRIDPNVAGIDCGSREHYVAVPTDRDPDPVKSFGTFTADLHRLADWLKSCGVRSVAMEATGVYWIPLYEILEARGFEVLLVNAGHFKNVRARKTDVLDCEWLRELHSVGLLRGSFRPDEAIVRLRGYMRHRDSLVEEVSSIIRRLQKALLQMNVQLPQVVTDITGVTGMAIMRDIVEGRTEPQQLARRRDPRCHATEAEFVAALTGNYHPEYVFTLKQNLQLFDLYQGMLADCDVAIEAHLQTMPSKTEAPPPPRRSKRQHRGNEPHFDVRGHLYRITGVDLSEIDGFGPYQALRLISEIGIDMTRWPTADQFASWTTLAPNNKITGGRLISSATPHSTHRAASIFRQVAMSVARTNTALGASYRRLSARIDKPQANTATARKIALLVYRVLKGEIVYQDPGADAYQAAQRQRAVRNLRKRAKYLGLDVVDPATGELVPA